MRIFIASLLLSSLLWSTTAKAQTADDILNILTKKGTLTQQEAELDPPRIRHPPAAQ